MKLDILKIDGSSSGEQLELSDDIFGVEPNDHAIYLAVKAYLANQRQGTSNPKERGEVRGGVRNHGNRKAEEELELVLQDHRYGLVEVQSSVHAQEITVRIYLKN